MGTLKGFDASKVEPGTSFEPVPAGWHKAMITASEWRPTKAGDGEYLQFVFEIIDGDHAGKKIFDRLNLQNPNPVAVDIAQKSLSAICHAVGVMTPEDSEELHDRPLDIKVAIRPAQGQYGASNELKGYRQTDGEKQRPKAATAPWKK